MDGSQYDQQKIKYLGMNPIVLDPPRESMPIASLLEAFRPPFPLCPKHASDATTIQVNFQI